MISEKLLQKSRALVPLGAMRNSHLKVLLATARLCKGVAGDSLFEACAHNDSIYFLLKGEIRLNHQSGRERRLSADSHWFPLVQFQRNEFSASARTDYQLMVLPLDQLDALLTWSQVADYLELDISYNRSMDADAAWLNTVLASNLFYKIPPLNIFNIIGRVSALEVKKGEVIITQGDSGDYCYFIKEGKARVSRDGSSEKGGQELAQIGAGRCFGEDALINKTTRNATVTMLEDGELIRLHHSEFQQLLIDPSTRHIKTRHIDDLNNEEVVFLDIRTQEEFDFRHIRNAVHIPFSLLRLKLRVLQADIHYVVYCNTGSRSRAAAFLLEQKGISVSVLDQGLSGLGPEHVEQYMIDDFAEFYGLGRT